MVINGSPKSVDEIYIMSNCWFSLQILFKNLSSPFIIALTINKSKILNLNS